MMAFRALRLLLPIFALLGLTVWQADVRTDIGDFFFAKRAGDSGFLAGQLQSEQMARQYLLHFSSIEDDAQVEPAFAEHLHQAISNLVGTRRVWRAGSADYDLLSLLEFYADHAIGLHSLQPRQAFASLTSNEGLDRQAQLIKEALLGPDPMLIKSLLERDPMLLVLHWASRLDAVTSDRATRSSGVSLFVEVQGSGLDTVSQEIYQRALAVAFDEVNQTHGGHYRMESTGVPVFATAIKQQVSSDIRRISTLSSITIGMLFLFVFRSLLGLFSAALLLATTVCCAILTTQLVFGYVHGLTLAIGITLIGVCVDYFIHGMVHMGAPSSDTRTAAIRRIWPSLLLGGATTFIGYTALSMSGFPGLQQIAVFAASGILVALLMTRYLLPVLMDQWELNLQPRWRAEKLLNALSRPRLLRYTVVAAMACFAIGLGSLQWSSDIAELAPSIQTLKDADRELRAKQASMEPGRFVLVEAEGMEQALVTTERAQSALSELVSSGELTLSSAVFPLLASAALQNENQRYWNQALGEGLQVRWRQALERAGLASELFPPLRSAASEVLKPGDLSELPIWPLLSRQFTSTPDRELIAIWLGQHDPAAVGKTIARVEGARYFSQKDSIGELARDYRETALVMLLGGALTISVMLVWRFRSLKRGLKVLIPATLALLVVLGGWGLVQPELTFMHLIGLLLTTAVCVDYGIFFLANQARNRVLTYQAILVSGLTTSVSFACLGAAANPALHALAWTVAPGVLLGLLLCPVVFAHETRTLGKTVTPTP